MSGICGNNVLLCVDMRKAFSLDNTTGRIRRALPYANMRKAFGLDSIVCRYVGRCPTEREKGVSKAKGLAHIREGSPLAQARPMGQGQRPMEKASQQNQGCRPCV